MNIPRWMMQNSQIETCTSNLAEKHTYMTTLKCDKFSFCFLKHDMYKESFES